jgi:hypothetical protein
MGGGLAGAAFPASRLSEFESAGEQGRILVIADAPRQDVENHVGLTKQLDSQVNVEGIGPPSALIPR